MFRKNLVRVSGPKTRRCAKAQYSYYARTAADLPAPGSRAVTKSEAGSLATARVRSRSAALGQGQDRPHCKNVMQVASFEQSANTLLQAPPCTSVFAQVRQASLGFEPSPPQ